MHRRTLPRPSNPTLMRHPKATLMALTLAAGLLSAGCSPTSSQPQEGNETSPSTSYASASADQPSSSRPQASTSSRATSPAPSATAPAHKAVSTLARIKDSCPSVLSWDDFHRSDRSLHRDRLPTGQTYYASGPDSQRIHRDRYVSDVQATPNPDILYVWLGRRPITLAARWVFTPGATSHQNAVIGVAPRHAVIGHRHLLGFGIGSVQLAIYTRYWQLFYITNTNYFVEYHTVAIGDFKHPLRQDARTVYQMSMRLHPSNSSVSITYPGGRAHFQNPAFSELWGRLYGLQVRRPRSTDGSARFLASASAYAACPASSLLGPLHRHR